MNSLRSAILSLRARSGRHASRELFPPATATVEFERGTAITAGMKRKQVQPGRRPAKTGKSTLDAQRLIKQVLQSSNSGMPRAEFLREIASLLLACSGSDAIELLVRDGRCRQRCLACRSGAGKVSVTIDCCPGNESVPAFPSGDVKDAGYKSCLTIPLVTGEDAAGSLVLRSRRPNHFTKAAAGLFHRLAQTIAMALVNQQTQAALRERVKELTCLYKLAQTFLSAHRMMISGEAREPAEAGTPTKDPDCRQIVGVPPSGGSSLRA